MTACHCDYDYDGPTIHRVTNPKARKAHKCRECSRPILPGETYESFWGVWDGEAQTYRTCSDCLALKKWVEAHVPCVCWGGFGGMHEDARNAIDEWERECPGLLAELDAKIEAIRTKRAALRRQLEAA